MPKAEYERRAAVWKEWSEKKEPPPDASQGIKNGAHKKTRAFTAAPAGQCDPAQSAVMDQDQT
jgi:hypothetical protein